jgi:NDP-sugar pyrophosphorylase family protein
MPLTAATPKVLLPLDGRPHLELVLRWLAGEGVREVAVNLHHGAEAIGAFIGDGSEWDLRVTCSVEPTPLGTAGALRPLARFLDRTFVVVYGDVLTRTPLEPLLERHFAANAAATIAVHRHPRPWEKGVVEVRDGFVSGFVEKPARGAETSDLVNAGIYVLEPSVFGHLPDRAVADFGHDVFPSLLEAGEPLAAYELETPLLDIGTPEAYAEAQGLARRLWPEIY